MVKKFLKDIIIFIFAVGVSRILPFILTPVFTHYISVDDMGALEIILSLYNILIIFGMMQIDTAVQRFFYEDESVAASGILMVFLISLITSLILLLSASTISKNVFGNLLYCQHIKVIAATIPLVNVFTLILLLVRYNNGVGSLVMLSMFQTTTFGTAAFYLVAHESMGSFGYLVSAFISFVLPAILGLWILRRNLKLYNVKNTIINLWSFSWPQLPARISSGLIQYGNRFIILAIFTQATVGIYAMANKVSIVMMVFLSAFNMVWYPILYKDLNSKKNMIKLRSIFNIVLVLLPLLLSLLYLMSYVIFNFLVASNFHAGLKISYIIILSTALLFIKEMVDAGIKISKKMHYISYIYLSSLVIMFVSSLILGKTFGLIGVAYSVFISNFFMTIITWKISNKEIFLGFSKVNFIISLGGMFCVTAIALRIS